jgi:AcrR family transcriptional regulator
MNNAPSNIEDKIIQAAIDCIEKYGLQGTTNRKIAEMAGVNSAAVNYYFRSKEALIDRCMQETLKNAFDWEDFNQLPANSPKEKCAAIFDDLIRGACNYPGLTRAHYSGLILEDEYDSLAVTKLNEFLIDLVEDLKKNGVQLEEKELQMAVSEIASVFMLMSLAPRIFKESFGIDMNDTDMRRRFIYRLVDRLL